MAVTIESLGIDQLSISERMALAQNIWDSIEADADLSPLTPRDVIDRRLAAHRADLDAAIPWERVEAEALERLEQ